MSEFGKANSKAEHPRIREMLSLYIDEELPSGDRARVEEHLAGCADCTWELDTLRQTVDLVGQLPTLPVPHAFTIHETSSPRRISLFQARWAYTYLRGATALVAALLILVLAGDALFQLQRITTGFAPAMAPAKEVAAPAAAPTVVAMQKAPPAPAEVPISPEEDLGEAEGAAYAEVTPSPLPVEETQAEGGDRYGAVGQATPVLPPGEETKALASMPTPTAPAARDYGLTAGAGAIATPLATPAPPVSRTRATGTPPPAASPAIAMEAPAEEVPEAPAMLAVPPTAKPQPQMTATPIPVVPLAPASVALPATPTPVALATATATPAPTATPLSMARAPAEVRPTEESALAGPPARLQRPRLTLLRVVEASLCLLVMALIAATLIVRRTQRNLG